MITKVSPSGYNTAGQLADGPCASLAKMFAKMLYIILIKVMT